MRRLWIVFALTAVILAGALLWTRLPGSTPTGQPPLATITAADELRREFNQSLSKTRVIVLLSPT